MGLEQDICRSWSEVLSDEFSKQYFIKLETFVEEERKSQKIYPPKDQVFTAFDLTPFEDVKVLLLGQDPYHGPGQAHGLSFSVREGIKIPPSLRNIYKEMESDVGCSVPKHGYLIPWAKQGVMMLNAVLTVRHKSANSHKNKGWEKFTDAVIKKLNDRDEQVIFLLWGGYAKKKADLIDTNRHKIISAPHPSPFSARTGFFGSKPFSKINSLLEEAGHQPVNWQLDNI